MPIEVPDQKKYRKTRASSFLTIREDSDWMVGGNLEMTPSPLSALKNQKVIDLGGRHP